MGRAPPAAGAMTCTARTAPSPASAGTAALLSTSTSRSESGSIEQGLAMTRNAGSYYIIGYGGTIQVPAIDMIFSEKNIIGNLVGSYADLTELMTLAGAGRVRLATAFYPLGEINQAIADLHHGRIKGRAVLIP